MSLTVSKYVFGKTNLLTIKSSLIHRLTKLK